MNVYNAGVAARLATAIQDYEAGLLSLAQVQSALQSAITLLENDGSGIADSVRLAEADLEEIHFTVLLDEQRPAAIFRLDELRATLGSAGDG
ncbi:hypothetical protein GU243_12025 [Pseudarthrobacter psychrotolerans]|uniref:Uncharacterized protein n=1 Tax=Pseudarthrobacter psychrotolerans TaxID=2697569 RepID=A0A6P1NU53_9MICC|nr:hypothetical protein [Pseudarthrobacter psychrotolerans]QHK20341.1 hypothetical protein GU243_12025 [Pseudarthrobacter psychrotolerans]